MEQAYERFFEVPGDSGFSLKYQQDKDEDSDGDPGVWATAAKYEKVLLSIQNEYFDVTSRVRTKQIRQVCREWGVNIEPFLLQRAYSALREGTMGALRQLSDH